MISTLRSTLSARADLKKPIETPAASPTSRPRIAWIDYARGFSILIVVIGHVVLGMRATGLLDDGPLLRIWDARYYNIRMPLFFVLSGLFAERWAGRRVRDFLRDKGATIVYPFFLWATLQTLVQVALNPITQGHLTLWHIVRQPVFPDGQFWFLHVLFCVMLGYFLLRKAGLSPTACVVVALGCYAMQGANPQESPLPLERALYYAPFYAIGGLAATMISRIRIERAAHLLAIAIAGFGALAVAVRYGGDPPLPVQLMAALCGIAGAIALTALLGRSRFMGFLPVLGRYSLEIFVAHMLSAAGLRIALHRIFHIENAAAHLILGSIAGIVGPLLLVWLCNRLGLRYAFRLPKPPKPGPAAAPQPARGPSLTLARASA